MDKPKRIWFFIKGMVELSDSIAYDLLCQQKLICEMYPKIETFIVAKDVNEQYYKQDIILWDKFIAQNNIPKKDDVLIYHYCDGWTEFEEYLESSSDIRQATCFLRWHNNTPPWFFIDNDNSFSRTMIGYSKIHNETSKEYWSFMTNSEFTLKQLQAIASSACRAAVVFPGSVHLDAAPPINISRDKIFSDKLKILFVGRLVEHKSHILIVWLAQKIQESLGVSVEINFAGRSSNNEYVDKILQEAQMSNVELICHGEVTDEGLTDLYTSSDLFVCFSQHEGFGLPIYEAMRYNLPVMALLTSAVEELLQGHPLTCKEYDLDFFVERIRALQDKYFYEKVIKCQHAILKIYNKDTIKRQLFKAFTDCDRVDYVNKYSRTDASVFKRSFDYKFLTLDDLYIFNSLISKTEKVKEKLSQITPGRYTYIDGQRFCSHLPTDENQNGYLGINIIGRPDIGPELWFGPYIKLSKGLYRIQICFFDVGLEEFPDLELSVDISSVETGVLMDKTFQLSRIPRLSSGKLIEFYYEDETDSSCELEIRGQLVQLLENCNAKFVLKWIGILPIC